MVQSTHDNVSYSGALRSETHIEHKHPAFWTVAEKKHTSSPLHTPTGRQTADQLLHVDLLKYL